MFNIREETALNTTSKLFEYYEYKFLVPAKLTPNTLNVLSHLYGNTDPFESGEVHSIYYDSLDRSCYNECLHGHERKTKFRIRSYNQKQFTNIQVKQKVLLGVTKFRSQLLRPAKRHENWSSLLKSCDDLRISALSSQFNNLAPVVKISYLRHRFRVFDYRITLDQNIRAIRMPAHRTAVKSFVAFPFNVLEIKTRSEQPFLPGFGLLNLSQISFSKFFLGLSLLEGEEQSLNKYL